MALFQRLFFAVLLAGLISGAAMAALQQWRVVPLIIAAEAYEGTEALLIEGFWTQLFASVALLLSGIALGRAVRKPAERARSRPIGTAPAREPHGRGATAGEGAGA